MEKLIVILTFAGSILALLFALLMARKVLKFSEGNDLMKKISLSIRKGANAYLKRQYKIVIISLQLCLLFCQLWQYSSF